ncbi:sensor histidine kinase [Brevundimonas sp.]|uniref:sensor histidine kinase n=1 Tax=Brevundimonas sp. TaxID=1871086 RepID=UPI00391CB087
MSLNDVALARLIIENVRSHGIIGLAPDGHITAWAAGAEAITGYSREDALGMNIADLFTPADQAAGMPQAEVQTALREGRAEDSRWHQRKDGSLFWGNGVTVDLGAGGLLAKIFRDETPAKHAEEQRVLLLNELNHRVKNTLATVQSIAEQGLRAAGVEKSVREGLSNRLIALSQAHNVLVTENWAGADLRTLICEVLAPYERDPSPIRMEGPPVRLHPSQAVSVSLACHELATNAAKYGALSTPDGRVAVDWNLAHNGEGQRFLTLLWRESGGPAVVPPTREGFGARLIRQTFAAEHGGRAHIQFPPEGAHCSLLLALMDEEPAEPGQPADPAPVPA